jgi:hypothetical protein
MSHSTAPAAGGSFAAQAGKWLLQRTRCPHADVGEMHNYCFPARFIRATLVGKIDDLQFSSLRFKSRSEKSAPSGPLEAT